MPVDLERIVVVELIEIEQLSHATSVLQTDTNDYPATGEVGRHESPISLGRVRQERATHVAVETNVEELRPTPRSVVVGAGGYRVSAIATLPAVADAPMLHWRPRI